MSGNKTVDTARRGIEQVETGGKSGVDKIEKAEDADPAGVEAVEQEASTVRQGVAFRDKVFYLKCWQRPSSRMPGRREFRPLSGEA